MQAHYFLGIRKRLEGGMMKRSPHCRKAPPPISFAVGLVRSAPAIGIACGGGFAIAEYLVKCNSFIR